jgi:hypothetical protein
MIVKINGHIIGQEAGATVPAGEAITTAQQVVTRLIPALPIMGIMSLPTNVSPVTRDLWPLIPGFLEFAMWTAIAAGIFGLWRSQIGDPAGRTMAKDAILNFLGMIVLIRVVLAIWGLWYDGRR